MTITAAAARRILRGQGMPPQEIRAVLASDDPLLVRRLLELHRERLEEWLEEQWRLVARLERSLVDEHGRRPPAPSEDTDVLPTVAARSGLLVIDEAHCRGDWGHDFRPDYGHPCRAGRGVGL